MIEPSTPVRLAVIGVGHLGKIHARLVQNLPGARLVAVVDPVAELREQVASELRTAALSSHEPLAGQIDAAIIATPTRFHYAVALDLLRRGVHVFVEKPITLSVSDADELIDTAAAKQLVLQVGHVERFNPALTAAQPHLAEPKYVDAVRAGSFTCRSTDIGVVLDLMIHDIDIVLSLVQEEVISVEALGAAVFGPNEDWAQARLTFAGGCVANLAASRVAHRQERTMHVVTPGCFATIDFAARQTKLMRPSDAVLSGEVDVNALSLDEKTRLKEQLFTDYLPLTDLPVTEANALQQEQADFLAAIRGQSAVQVSGRDGRNALDVAERILTSLAGHRWEGFTGGAMGPRIENRPSTLRGPHWHRAGQGIIRGRRKAG